MEKPFRAGQRLPLSFGPKSKKILAVFVSAVIFYSDVVAARAAESNFWAERKTATRKLKQEPAESLTGLGLAADPQPHSHLSLEQYQTLAQLPQASQLDFNLDENKAIQSALGTSPASLVSPNQFHASVGAQNPSWISKLLLPYGSVREIYLSKSANAPLVIQIQDAHGIEEAQRNIASIIQGLREARGINMVGLEGASGGFTIEPYRNLPDASITKDIAEYLLKQGYIGGPEFAGFTAPEPPLLWGVEDMARYESNVRALKDSLPQKNAMRSLLAELRRAADGLKEKIYSAPLKEFDTRFDAYRNQGKGLGDYVRYLMETYRGDKIPTSNLQLLLDALNREKSLDFKQVEKERLELVDVLASRLPEKQLSWLVQQSLQYRLGHMSYGDYHQFLKNLCQKNGVNLKNFSQLNSYIEYVLLAERISRSTLLVELSRLEDATENFLAVQPDQKKLVAINRNILLLGKLADHSMTMPDWANYEKNKQAVLGVGEDIQSLTLVHGGPISSKVVGDLSAMIKPLEQFCFSATQRNDSLVENLMAKMKSEKAKSAVLVAGGFHTDGLAQILRQKDISYVVVTPKITEVPKDSHYLDVFARDPVPLEKLFAGERIYLAYALRFAARQPDSNLIESPEPILDDTMADQITIQAPEQGQAAYMDRVKTNVQRAGLRISIVKTNIQASIKQIWFDINGRRFKVRAVQRDGHWRVTTNPAGFLGRINFQMSWDVRHSLTSRVMAAAENLSRFGELANRTIGSPSLARLTPAFLLIVSFILTVVHAGNAHVDLAIQASQWLLVPLTITGARPAFKIALPSNNASSPVDNPPGSTSAAEWKFADVDDLANIRSIYFLAREKLVGANYAALKIITSPAPITKRDALAVLGYAEQMVKAFEILSPNGYPWAREIYESQSANVQTEKFNALGDDAVLNAEHRKKITSLDPLPDPEHILSIQSLHTLIKFFHGAGDQAMDKYLGSVGANEVVVFKNKKIQVANLTAGALMSRDGKIINRPLRLIFQALEEARDAGQGTYVIIDNHLTAHIPLGHHAVDLSMECAEPGDGGFLRIRYVEGGNGEGNQLRGDFLKEVMTGLGINVDQQVSGSEREQYSLIGKLDKDHGAWKSEQLADAFVMTLRALHTIKNLDRILDSIYRDEKERDQAGRPVAYRVTDLVAYMAETFLAEGKLPFRMPVFRGKGKPWDMSSVETYRANAGARDAERARLNRGLAACGLPLIPADVAFGKRLAEKYTRAVEDGLVRNEFVMRLDGIPQRNPAYDPIAETLADIIPNTAAAIQAGMTFDSLPKDAIPLKPVGSVGRLMVVEGQLKLAPGKWIVVRGLRDPAREQLRYASFKLFDAHGDHRVERLWTNEFVKAVNGEGYSIKQAKRPNDAKIAKAERLLRAKPQNAEVGDTGMLRGLPASPGDGKSVAGRVAFDDEHMQDGMVLIKRFTTIDDLDAIDKAVAVVTTGGVLLSHMATATNERGIPGVILHGAEWATENGKPLLKASVARMGPAEMNRQGLWPARAIAARQIEIREGDFVEVNGRDGTVAVLNGLQLTLPMGTMAEGVNGPRGKEKVSTGIPKNVRHDARRQQEPKAERPISPLGAIGMNDVGSFGGKAASLGEVMWALRELGADDVYVPDGLAISTELFEQFMDENPGMRAEYEKLIGALDSGLNGAERSRAIQKYSDELRKLILADGKNLSALDRELREAMDGAKMNGKAVAVRSSARQEDTRNASFAGTAETELNATQNLAEKIRRIWASFFLPRGIVYRAARGISEADMHPAALVQEMVDAEISGVIFTVNAMSGDADDNQEIVINSTYGLGEALVSGSVEGDTYWARKSDGEEIDVLVGSKEERLDRNPAGGTKLSLVPPEERHRRSLTTDQVTRLTWIATELEEHFGYPLDIEFAIDKDGNIAILQARPVTTAGNQSVARVRQGESSIAAGAVGIWKYLANRYSWLNLPWIGVLETPFIVGMALLLAQIGMSHGPPFVGLPYLLNLALSSGIIFSAGYAGLFFAHYAFGVLQYNSISQKYESVHSAQVAFRAALTASASLVSVPFILWGLSMMSSSSHLAVGVMAAGAVVGAILHAWRNAASPSVYMPNAAQYPFPVRVIPRNLPDPEASRRENLQRLLRQYLLGQAAAPVGFDVVFKFNSQHEYLEAARRLALRLGVYEPLPGENDFIDKVSALLSRGKAAQGNNWDESATSLGRVFPAGYVNLSPVVAEVSVKKIVDMIRGQAARFSAMGAFDQRGKRDAFVREVLPLLAILHHLNRSYFAELGLSGSYNLATAQTMDLTFMFNLAFGESPRALTDWQARPYAAIRQSAYRWGINTRAQSFDAALKENRPIVVNISEAFDRTESKLKEMSSLKGTLRDLLAAREQNPDSGSLIGLTVRDPNVMVEDVWHLRDGEMRDLVLALRERYGARPIFASNNRAIIEDGKLSVDRVSQALGSRTMPYIYTITTDDWGDLKDAIVRIIMAAGLVRDAASRKGEDLKLEQFLRVQA